MGLMERGPSRNEASVSSNPLVRKVLDDASKLSFFWEKADKYMCQKRLNADDVEDGTYILRKSGQIKPSDKKIVTLSVKKTFNSSDTKVWHFPIFSYWEVEGISVCYYMASTQKRSSIVELLQFHQNTPLKGENLPAVCQLVKGLPYEPNFKDSPNTLERKKTETNYPILYPKPPVPSPRPSPRPRLPCPEPVAEPMCHCGLPLSCTRLPEGWTVHLSNRDDETNGFLYFLDPMGRSTWQLHPDIDSLCNERRYLNYGRLNIDNFRMYELDYVSTSELKRIINSNPH